MKIIERLAIDSDLLLTFVQIAECGNLTVAAGKLGRTQSAISVQLRKLEECLSVTLFERTVKGMILTPAGETLLSRARPILDELQDTIRLFQVPLTGSIHVGLPDDFDEVVLEHILRQFSQTHPSVQVLARSGCTSGYAAAIQSGELDIAVCSGTDHPGEALLNTEEIVWAGRSDIVLEEEEEEEAEVLLALLDRPCHWRDLPMKALDNAGRSYKIAFQSSSFTSLQAALRSGIAIGLLPKSALSPGLRILTEKNGLPSLPVSYRSILKSDKAPDNILHAMEDAIRNAPML